MTKEELDKLTPEQKRTAIAETCGWKKGLHGGDWWISGDPNVHKDSEVPDYLNDLNAMNDAEKHLETDEQIERYCEYLTDVSGGDTPIGKASFCAYFSTASQRAEAFLLAL